MPKWLVILTQESSKKTTEQKFSPVEKSNGMVQCEHFSCQQCFWIKQIVTACDLTNKCLHLRHFVSVVASVTRSCFVLGLKLHL